MNLLIEEKIYKLSLKEAYEYLLFLGFDIHKRKSLAIKQLRESFGTVKKFNEAKKLYNKEIDEDVEFIGENFVLFSYSLSVYQNKTYFIKKLWKWKLEIL